MEKIIILPFNAIHNTDVKSVGGKNASLGEMYNELSSKGIKVPDGFVVSVYAYWDFLYSNQLKQPLEDLLAQLNRKDYSNLKDIGAKCRSLMMAATLPGETAHGIVQSYIDLCNKYDSTVEVAVRSSATAEDLPTASFAGQHESYLNIRGEKDLLDAVKRCYVSLFTDRAIKYREDNGFQHLSVGISAGVQKMVRSDVACSGIAFTLEPESGFKDLIHISGTWGLGENIVQGNVIPDEFYVFKPTLKAGMKAIVSKKLGTKAKTMIYAEHTDHEQGKTVVNIPTTEENREHFVLDDDEITQIAKWALIIEEHYKQPMDIEWAKDGMTNEIYVVQARPETAHAKKDPYKIKEYSLKEKGKVIVKGSAVGSRITAGIARVLHSPKDSDRLKQGEVLITEITNPDWDPILKKASAIVTDKGGRTSHAAIVARELGVAAIVGTEDATRKIKDSDEITVSCEGETGNVYKGIMKWEEKEIDIRNIKMPNTKAMLIIADPDKAFKLSIYPNNGIGLMRLEFIINNSIRIHPMALVKFKELKDAEVKNEIEKLTHHYENKEHYFVEKLAQSVATIACAFYPKEVIVRMSDFKTNEYANLLGGKEFEPKEENPMIGFRGASRYYNERYREGFRLECEAMKVIRNEMGLSNVKLMIPFCRTVEEGKKVIEEMAGNGLKRGENGLEIYVMAEIPSNVLLADEFAKIFDGFSIGSNDLTQLTLGIDRDNAIISNLFSEQNAAAREMIETVIKKAKKADSNIGLCGQAPSDFPEFAQFLVETGIDSISFNADALIKGIENIVAAEEKIIQKNKKQPVISLN